MINYRKKFMHESLAFPHIFGGAPNAFVSDCLFKDVCILQPWKTMIVSSSETEDRFVYNLLEDRDSISFWRKGQAFLLSRANKICLQWIKGGHTCPICNSGSLNWRFFFLNATYFMSRHPFGRLCSCSVLLFDYRVRRTETNVLLLLLFAVSWVIKSCIL